jgi:hypothetical protein
MVSDVRELEKLPLHIVAEMLDRLDAQISEEEEMISDLKRDREALIFIVVPKKMEEEGITQLRLKGGRGLTLTSEVLVSVLAENREQQHEWLRDIGADSLIQPVVNASSFQSFIRERLGEMQEVPEFVKLHPRQRAKFLPAPRKK